MVLNMTYLGLHARRAGMRPPKDRPIVCLSVCLQSCFGGRRITDPPVSIVDRNGGITVGT